MKPFDQILRLIFFALSLPLRFFIAAIDFVTEIDDEDDEDGLDEIEELVESILERPQSDLDQIQSQIDDCFRLMDLELEELHDQQKGFMPSNNFFGGLELANLAGALAKFFHDEKDLDNESRAVSISTQSILTCAGHYHHIVGPAMLAYADVKERQGDIDAAIKAYDAVLQDFKSQIERMEDERDDYAIYGENLLVAESLATACSKLIELNSEKDVIRETYQSLIDRVNNLKSGELSPFSEDKLNEPIVAVLKSNGRVKCPTCGWNMMYCNEDECSNCGQKFDLKRKESE